MTIEAWWLAAIVACELGRFIVALLDYRQARRPKPPHPVM